MLNELTFKEEKYRSPVFGRNGAILGISFSTTCWRSWQDGNIFEVLLLPEKFRVNTSNEEECLVHLNENAISRSRDLSIVNSPAKGKELCRRLAKGEECKNHLGNLIPPVFKKLHFINSLTGFWLARDGIAITMSEDGRFIILDHKTRVGYAQTFSQAQLKANTYLEKKHYA